MKTRSRDSENGQVLVIFALALFTVILGAAAIAIDLGNGQLEKRRLQNITDAAALAAASQIARGGDDTSAQQAAQDIVTHNSGGALSLPVPPGNTGTGAGLTNGIEINGSEVRVALTRRVSSFFAGVFGVGNIPVLARSHVSNVASGAIMPIAVKRFSGGDTSKPFSMAGTVYDAVAPMRGASNPLTDWPFPLTDPAATPPVFTDWTALAGSPTDSDSGPVIPILGADAGSNVGSPDYHFWIAPDVRNIWPGPAQFFNGVQPGWNVQTLKDLSEKYILSRGYTGPLPHVGDQIATLNGVDTGNAVAAMRKTFKEGEVVSAMVYDGTLYQTPDFSMSVSPSFGSTTPNEGTGGNVNYTVTVTPTNGFNGWLNLRAYGLETPEPSTPPATLWGEWKFSSVAPGDCVGAFGSACSVYVASWSGPVNATLTVKPYGGDSTVTPHIPPATRERSVLIVASYAPGVPETTLARVATVKVRADPGSGTFSVASPQATIDIQVGSSKTVDLKLFDNGFGSNVKIGDIGYAVLYNPDAPPATLSFVPTPGGVSFNPRNPQNKSPNAGGTATLQMDINVSSSATPTTAPTGYLIKVPVIATSGGTPSQDYYLFLRILPTAPSGNTVGNISSFVYILGHADFVISYGYDQSGVVPAGDSSILTKNSSMDGNTIYAYAVSGLYDPYDPSTMPPRKLTSRPRLVPW